MNETKEKEEKSSVRAEWEIWEYEKILFQIRELSKSIKNPSPELLHSEFLEQEKTLSQLLTPRVEAYRFVRKYIVRVPNVVFCNGKISGQYAIYLGDKSNAGYSRYLFFDHRNDPVRLPCSLITSAEEFQQVPIPEFIRAVVASF